MLERQSDWASALAFTPDNRQLLVGRMNGELHMYSVDPRWANAANDLQPLDETAYSTDIAPSTVLPSITEIEPNDIAATATVLTVPGIAKGELKPMNGATSDVDFYRIQAKHGERFVIETNAARSGSLADTKIDVLHADGRPVLRALLQAVRDSWINFRPID